MPLKTLLSRLDNAKARILQQMPDSNVVQVESSTAREIVSELPVQIKKGIENLLIALLDINEPKFEFESFYVDVKWLKDMIDTLSDWIHRCRPSEQFLTQFLFEMKQAKRLVGFIQAVETKLEKYDSRVRRDRVRRANDTDVKMTPQASQYSQELAQDSASRSTTRMASPLPTNAQRGHKLPRSDGMHDRHYESSSTVRPSIGSGGGPRQPPHHPYTDRGFPLYTPDRFRQYPQQGGGPSPLHPQRLGFDNGAQHYARQPRLDDGHYYQNNPRRHFEGSGRRQDFQGGSWTSNKRPRR